MLNLEGWKPTTSSESGSGASNSSPPGFATVRLEEAQRERIWAIVEANTTGFGNRTAPARRETNRGG